MSLLSHQTERKRERRKKERERKRRRRNEEKKKGRKKKNCPSVWLAKKERKQEIRVLSFSSSLTVESYTRVAI
jgi:phage terminase small subunit